MISDEAIEAAAKAIYHTSGRARQMPYSVAREACEDEAREVLEAAAPYMLSEERVTTILRIGEPGAKWEKL